MRHIALGLAFLLVAEGCTSARKRADATVVRRIKFEGNGWLPIGDHTDYALRDQMAQRPSPALVLTWPFRAFVQASILREKLLRSDTERLETYLAHHGWFDADIAWRYEEKRKERRRKVGVIDVIGEVERGPMTRWVDAARLDGDWDGRPAWSRALPAQLHIHRNHRFVIDDVYRAQEDLQAYLWDEGFAFATVEPDVVARPETQEAEVTLDIDVGPVATVGEVRLEGVTPGTEKRLLHIADLRPGARFSGSELELARDALYQTGAFNRVAITPDLSSEDSGVVPIDILVEQGPPRQVQLGVRAGLEGSFFRPEVLAGWSHDDAGGMLRRIHLGLSAGFGYAPVDQRTIPLVQLDARYSTPQFLSPKLAFDMEVGVRSDIYEYTLPRTDGWFYLQWTLSLGRAFSAYIQPRAQWTRLAIPTTEAERTVISSALGPGFINEYGLAQIAWGGLFDGMRQRGGRTHGLSIALDGRNALPLGGFTSFHEVELDFRGHLAPHRPVFGRPIQLLGRFDIGGVFGVEDQIPYPERRFLGGAGNLRGFRSGQVGTYDCLCVRRPRSEYTGHEREIRRHYLPRGGLATALIAGEVQFHRVLFPELRLAAFAEIGSMSKKPLGIIYPFNYRVAAGIGARYDTSVGPFRVDLAIRPLYAEDAGPEAGRNLPLDSLQLGSPFGADVRPGQYIGCDLWGPRRRAFDIFSEFNRRGEYNRSFPPAINIFISIGEAL